jgi:hypothetical protein
VANQFIALAVPAADGAGAPTSVSAMDAVKTVVVEGAFTGTLLLEASSAAAGTDFAPVASFTSGENFALTVSVVAARLRVRRTGTAGGPVPTVTLGLQDGQTLQLFAPVVPANGSGPGASLSVATSGKLKTFQIGGGPYVGVVTVEGSEDGATWDTVVSFASGATPLQTVTSRLQFVRVNNRATQDVGAPAIVVLAAAQDDASGGGGGVASLMVFLSDSNRYGASGPEDLLAQWNVDLTDVTAANIAVRIAALIRQTGGGNFFRIRTGGTIGVPTDGTIRATLTTASAVFVAASNLGAAFANPGGQLLVKLTGNVGEIEGSQIRIG